jgi:hypothetical protein
MHSYEWVLKTCGHKLGLLSGVTIILIGSITAVRADDIAGTVAKAEPPTKQEDGTLAHPYADANQCPPKTDIIIWPKEWRSDPSFPREFAVCYVMGQSKNNDIQRVRER